MMREQSAERTIDERSWDAVISASVPCAFTKEPLEWVQNEERTESPEEHSALRRLMHPLYPIDERRGEDKAEPVKDEPSRFARVAVDIRYNRADPSTGDEEREELRRSQPLPMSDARPRCGCH